MIVFEYRAYGSPLQFAVVDEAIKVTQFIRNKGLRHWIDHKGVGKYDLNTLCKTLAAEYPFADHLNSMARQSASERAWSAIARFYDACKKKVKGKKGYPKFKKNVRSVEYKTSGWKLSEDRKGIKFTDGCGIGTLKLKSTRDLSHYQLAQFKRRLRRPPDSQHGQESPSRQAHLGRQLVRVPGAAGVIRKDLWKGGGGRATTLHVRDPQPLWM